MSLHYSDESKRPRECPGCSNPEKALAIAWGPCGFCDGTGRLGDEGAEPDIEVDLVLRVECAQCVDTDADTAEANRPCRACGDVGSVKRFSWRIVGRGDIWTYWRGTYPTESAAVEAARKAIRGSVGTDGPDFSGADHRDELGDGEDERILGGRW